VRLLPATLPAPRPAPLPAPLPPARTTTSPHRVQRGAPARAALVLAAFALGACCIVVGSVGGGCAHGPSAQDRTTARGHYEVAVALVQEGQRAAANGDQPTRDDKYREALKELLEAERLVPEDSELQLLLGQVFFLGFRRHDDAVVHLERAIALKAAGAPADAAPAEREYAEAEQTLGVVLVDKGQTEAALPHFEKARTNLLYGTPYFAEQEMGRALFLLGRHDDAVRHLTIAVQQQPDLCGAYAKLAEVHEARGDEAQVQKSLEDFLVRCDSERLRANVGAGMIAPALFKLGESRLRSGSKDGAVDAFRSCASRFPTEAAGGECARRLELLGVSLSPSSVSAGG
jgi:type IV pilus assembly protein PilF